MSDFLKLVLAGVFGVVVSAALGLMWLGKLDNRVTQSERRIDTLETKVERLRVEQSATPNPARQQCAELARTRAAGTGNSYDIDAAMDRLGCVRAN